MGCKGSKRLSSSFRCGIRKRRSRVEPLQGANAFNTNVHPAKSRLNKDVCRGANINDVVSVNFKGFKSGDITYRSPAPIRDGVSNGINPAENVKENNIDQQIDSGLCLRTDSTWVARQILERGQENHVADSSNDRTRLPPIHMSKMANGKQMRNNNPEEVVSKEPIVKRERPMAAKGYRKAFLLNRPSLPDIPAFKKQEDIPTQDIKIEIDFKNRVPPMPPNSPTTSEVEIAITYPRENAPVENVSLEHVYSNITERVEDRAHPQRIRPMAAKGRRKDPFFQRLSSPILPPEIKPHNGSGKRSDPTQELVLEDVEDWEDDMHAL